MSREPDDVVRARLEEAAGLCEEAGRELERAVGHCRVAAEHFRNREIPRATAHAWAAFGHLSEAQRRLEAQARMHAERARLLGDPI